MKPRKYTYRRYVDVSLLWVSEPLESAVWLAKAADLELVGEPVPWNGWRQIYVRGTPSAVKLWEWSLKHKGIPCRARKPKLPKALTPTCPTG